MATTAAATNDEIDALIGSLNSVYAGDRGHALCDLRSSLFSSLGNVALGPSSTAEDQQPACAQRRQTTPGPSCPSPPLTPQLPQWTLLPPATLDTTKHKARPANLRTRSTRSLYTTRVRPSPYSFAPMISTGAGSRGASRRSSPEEPQEHHRHHHHPRPKRPTSSRCSSASTLSSVTSVAGDCATSPRSPTASLASTFDVATPKLSPWWTNGLARLTPLDDPSGAPDMHKTDSSASSAAESLGTLSPSFSWGQSSTVTTLDPNHPTYSQLSKDSAVSPCTLPLPLPATTTTTQDEHTSRSLLCEPHQLIFP